jgi:hypothetical protein
MHEHNIAGVKYIFPYLNTYFSINYLRQKIIMVEIVT